MSEPRTPISFSPEFITAFKRVLATLSPRFYMLVNDPRGFYPPIAPEDHRSNG